MTNEDPRPWRVHVGDARHSAALFDEILGENGELTLTVTSPPYHALVDYGHEQQVGFGQSLEEYLLDCANLFRAIRERTSVYGSMWLVVDSIRDRSAKAHLPLPFLLMQCATANGWTCQDVLIWRKDKGLPWSDKRRLRNSFEYILHFSVSGQFKFNANRLRSFEDNAKWWVRFPERYHPEGQVPTNVWDFPIPLQGSWNGSTVRHPCPLPDGLVDRIVQLASDEGDVIFDPFAGTGAVVRRANALGRRAFGMELDPAASAIETPSRESQSTTGSEGPTPQQVMELRALKWARLVAEAGRQEDGQNSISTVLVRPDTAALVDGLWVIDVAVYFYVSDWASLDRVENAAAFIAARKPASKFGVVGKIHCLPVDELSKLKWSAGELYVYSAGRTWKSVAIGSEGLPNSPSGRGRKYPPIVAPTNLSFIDDRA